MVDNLQHQNILISVTYKQVWLMNNKGVLTQVAKETGVSRQFVAKVFAGRGKSRRIEEALRKLRAPGFEKPRVNAA
jgi:DNA-binding phage protein